MEKILKVCRFFSVHFGVIGFLSEFSSNLFLIYQKISKTPWREPTSLLFCIIRQKCDYFLISKLVTYFVLWYICLNFYGLKKYFFLNVFEIFIIGGVIHVYLIFQTPPPPLKWKEQDDWQLACATIKVPIWFSWRDTRTRKSRKPIWKCWNTLANAMKFEWPTGGTYVARWSPLTRTLIWFSTR